VSVFDRFEESPFGPLGEHMREVKECVALVEPMFRRVQARDFEGLRAITQQVFKLEHQADQIKNEIRRRIPKSFYLPIYRGDLLAYLKLQDDMADSVEDVGVLLTIKNLEMPEAMADHIMELVRRVLTVCEYLFQCTDQLTNLVEEDFEGPRCKAILDLVAKAEHAEWRADKAQYTASQKLFSLEDEIRATDIMLWSNVFQQLGKLANQADNTAERLRRMLVH
jgi:uncharacterized protein